MRVKLRGGTDRRQDSEVFDDGFQYLKSIKKKRTCLMCGKIFNSKSASNRRCPKCQKLANSRVEGSVSDSLIYKIMFNDSYSMKDNGSSGIL